MRQTDASANAMLDAINAQIGPGAKLQGWTIPRPAALGDPETGTKLFELAMSNPALAPATGRVAALAAVTPAAALASGALDHLRIVTSGGAAVMDVPAAEITPPAGSDGHVSEGSTVELTGATITLPQGD